MLTVKTAIRADRVGQYQQELEVLWIEAVGLNSSVYLLERIASFPFKVLGVTPAPFWTLTRRALFESSVMALWRLALDRDKRTLTLGRFTNFVVDSCSAPELQDELRRALAPLEIDRNLERLEASIETLRHEALAHLNRDTARAVRAGSKELPRVSLAELMAARDFVNHVIATLSFDEGKSFVPLQYSPLVQRPPDADSRPDIERLLDELAQESLVLRMPEEQPEFWPQYRTTLSPEDLRTVNAYRRKFNRPEV